MLIGHTSRWAIAGALAMVPMVLASGFAASDPQVGLPGADDPEVHEARNEFIQTHDHVGVYARGARTVRVFGKAFAHGPTPLDAAESFRQDHADVFGVRPDDLVPGGRFRDGRVQTPIKYDRATGEYEFTGVYYQQFRDGLPVFRGQMVVLVRNEANAPVVLASADVRPLADDYQPLVGFAPMPAGQAANQIGAVFQHPPTVSDPELMVFAGVGDDEVEPVLAYHAFGEAVDPVTNAPEALEVVIDAVTGDVLFTESLIVFCGGGGGTVEGQVDGMSNPEIGAIPCSDVEALPMPYAEVTDGINSTFADVNGAYSLPSDGASSTVTSVMGGLYFRVFNFAGPENEISQVVGVPGIADFLHDGSDEVIAQINAYRESNIVRDFILAQNPDYPTIATQTNFPVNVNRTDGFCPGNAWYSGDSINFCLPGGGAENTAFSDVVHHEYGHHLVNTGGSGQGAYGEGMSDVMSLLISDDNRLGVGFGGNCTTGIRDADNNLQYPCSGGSHFCGQLISGCVWETRNALAITDPDDYIDILANLAVNAVLVHTGTSIDPSITIDYLTLDDNDDNIFNGTPHYAQIAEGFGEHSMDAPELQDLDFQFPNGLPDVLAPSGAVIEVNVVGVLATPEPGAGLLHVDYGDGVQTIAMNQIAPNQYEAVFPAGECGGNAAFFFSAETTDGSIVETNEFGALVADDLEIAFEDDFETDQLWTVQNAGGLTDGAWERGAPIGGGDRGDPPTDADGSGQCFLTDNADGNSDVDDGQTILRSPRLDAVAVDGDALVGYWRWYSNTQGQAPMSDIFRVEISSDNGLSWTPLETVGPAGPEVDGGWFYQQFRIADFVTPTDQVRLRFIAEDADPGSVVEAGVDGVSVFGAACNEAVPGDLDGDGVVGPADLAILLSQWGTDGSADFDGSGAVDPGDLAFLLANWS